MTIKERAYLWIKFELASKLYGTAEQKWHGYDYNLGDIKYDKEDSGELVSVNGYNKEDFISGYRNWEDKDKVIQTSEIDPERYEEVKKELDNWELPDNITDILIILHI